MKKILVLGCGEWQYQPKKEDHPCEIHNLDYVDRKQPNFINHNLNLFPYPYADNTFDKIIMYNVLEHLCLYDRYNEYWINIFSELYRILTPDGKVEILAPHFAGCASIMEHHHLFSCGDFYLKFKHKKQDWLTMMNGMDFRIDHMEITFPRFNKWIGKLVNMSEFNQTLYEKYFCGIIRSVDLLVILAKDNPKDLKTPIV